MPLRRKLVPHPFRRPADHALPMAQWERGCERRRQVHNDRRVNLLAPRRVRQEAVLKGDDMPKRALTLLSSRRWPYWLTVTMVAAAYLLAAKFGFTLAVVAKQVTAVGPPTGIALAALLLFGQDLWPAISLSAFLVNQQADEPWLTACAIAAGNTLEALLAAWLLRRVAGFENRLERLRDVFALIGFAALLSTAVSATIGVTSLCLGQVVSWSSFGSAWLGWWMGDALWDLIVAPLLLTWAAKPRLYPRAWRIDEAAAFVLVLVIIGVIFFASRWAAADPDYHLLRCGPRCALANGPLSQPSLWCRPPHSGA
ncbi:MAG: hypothetical protein DMG06_12425 [Acidobacteria bacterium]|nr:MAG: hypothetical protein DMG06_12425 [Acidobacteriota bacterium]